MKDDGINQRRERYLEYIKNFRLMDDDFMKLVFEDTECVQVLLRVIMDMPDLLVKSVKTEYTVHNIHGRGVLFDVYAIDGTGRAYNIEIQRDDKGAGRKRARLNSSMLDCALVKEGDNHDKIPETYVIFITENDVLGSNLPIYHVDRVISETGELFNDESHIIYVNGNIQDDTALGRLMHDFICTNASDMHYDVLAKRVGYFKESERGVSSMCKAMEDFRAEVRAEGRTEGEAKKEAEIIEKLRRSGMSEDTIQKILATEISPK
jgi:hypothetical protein